MPYLPDLIPKDHQVIPEYFHKQLAGQKTKRENSAITVLLGLLFLLVAICFIRYIWFATLFGLLALTCTKGVKRWMEKIGQFSLTRVARSVIYGFVILLSVPVYLSYAHQDEVDAAQKVLAHERALRFTADSLQADSGRKVELYALLGKAAHLAPDTGLRLLAKADGLIKTVVEQDSAKNIKQSLQLQFLQRSLNKKDFKASLATVQKLLEGDPRKPELWFYRARCYIGLDSIQMAVNDLGSAKALNYRPAVQLYETINPLKRHVVGYCTLCADGSTSYATGRGACSWHGGVAEWNHPIYETSRKYGEQ